MLFCRTIFLTALVLVFSLCLLPATASAKVYKRLVVTHDTSYHPYSFVGKYGEPKGYLIDFWQHFGEVNNVEIVFKLTNMRQSIGMLKKGAADIHGGMFDSRERARHVDFGPLIAPLATHLYAHESLDEKQQKSFPVGVLDGGYAHYYARSKRMPYITFPHVSDMIKAASMHEVMAFLADEPTAIYYMNEFGISNEFRKVKALYTKNVHVAVRKGDRELLGFLNRSWKNLDRNKLDEIKKKWVATNGPDIPWLFIAAGAFALLVLVALVHQTIASRKKSRGR